MFRRVARPLGVYAMFLLSACLGQSDDRARPEGTFTHPASTEDDAGSRATGPSLLDAAASADMGSEAGRDGEAGEADAADDSGALSSGDAASLADADAGADAGEGADGGGPAGSCPGLFCEDFESGGLNGDVWTRVDTDSPDNVVGVQSAVVAHGGFAAHFHAKGGTSRAMMFNDALPSALGTHYFGRANLRIKGFPTENGGHTAYMTASASKQGYPYNDKHLEIGHYFQSGGAIWQLTYSNGAGTESIASGGHIPDDQWFCIEWEFNDKPDAIAVWVEGASAPNGAEFRNVSNGASDLLGGLKTLGLGFRTYHPLGAPDTDVYLDDIVLDSKRTPCLSR